jgi:hypothetical protein
MADPSSMQGDAIAMLFAPPQPPVSLPREGTVVLGRSRECEVRLPDADTSRRHAKIVCSGGRFVLYDLGSTNGTFVNGERVGERELAPGDRLQVGANAVTFCQVAGGLDQPDDSAQTVLFERSVAGEVFRGDLARSRRSRCSRSWRWVGRRASCGSTPTPARVGSGCAAAIRSMPRRRARSASTPRSRS